MLHFDSVSFQYKNNKSPILDNLCFKIKKGAYYYLTGRNGAGKTSLLSLIYMNKQSNRGTIRLMGQDITRCPAQQKQALRRKMGVLFQEPRLIEHVSVFDNVALALRISHVSEQNTYNSVNELLSWLELDNKKNHLPSELSGGERQCIALARAVIHRPLLILADEPTAHIDNTSSKKVLRLLEELNLLGTTIILTTHDQWIIESFPHPQLNLDNGRISTVNINDSTFFKPEIAGVAV